MRKLLFASCAVGLFGLVAACSQGDTHPPLLGDCTCGSPIVAVGGGDSGTDSGDDGATAFDASDASVTDAADDGDSSDGALQD